MPVFVNANRQLASYKSQLDAQFNGQLRRTRSDAAKQQLAMQFQQQLNDKQREIVGPLFQRAQLAIAAVSSSRNLSIVVDKRIVIFGGQDITKDVEAVFPSPQAIQPPAATPPPSEIGYVDQTVLDGVPKVQTANSAMQQFEATQRQVYAARMAQTRSPSDKQQAAAQSSISRSPTNKISFSSRSSIRPASRPSDVARKKNLLLVVDTAPT